LQSTERQGASPESQARDAVQPPLPALAGATVPGDAGVAAEGCTAGGKTLAAGDGVVVAGRAAVPAGTGVAPAGPALLVPGAGSGSEATVSIFGLSQVPVTR
jgi:hypothetical protein